jgi:hypothetical protein
VNISRRGFLSGGLGVLTGLFGAKVARAVAAPALEMAEEILPPLSSALVAPGTFVFRPGVLPSLAAQGVFGSWASMMQAVNASSGLRTILVDADAATIPKGVHDLRYATFQGRTDEARWGS